MIAVKALVALAVAVGGSQAAQMTVYNNCPFQIWPGVYADPSTKASGVGGDGGFALAAYDSQSFDVPDNWNSGRIWGRRDCDFSKPDTQACIVGSCIGGLKCTQPGIPPVSLAEFTLVPGGQDNYDLSFVDGFDLPISITPSVSSCPAPSCNVDISQSCPSDLVIKDSNGYSIACESSCLKYGDPKYCCTGAYGTASQCPEDDIPSAVLFHDKCPQGYSYAYDEHDGVLKTCNRDASSSSDYTVTFCPA